MRLIAVMGYVFCLLLLSVLSLLSRSSKPAAASTNECRVRISLLPLDALRIPQAGGRKDTTTIGDAVVVTVKVVRCCCYYCWSGDDGEQELMQCFLI